MKYLFISLFILILSFLNIFNPIQSLFNFALNPLQKIFRQVGLEIVGYTDFLNTISSIYDENQQLKEEVLNLHNSLVKFQDIRDENFVLREQFIGSESDFSQNKDFSIKDTQAEPVGQFIVANITGNSEDLTKSTVYIDKGFKQGVSVDDPIVYKNNLVGKVVSVYSNRSLIALLYSPQINATARNISANNSTEGVITGEHGIGIKLDRVLQKELLNLGDVFVTSGREGVFPQNLIVGKVSEIYDNPTEPLKSARISPLIEIDRLLKVFVMVGDN